MRCTLFLHPQMAQEPNDVNATEPQESLIQRATSVFMRLGVRAVNMADVSSELGISKKTLYKYVSDKRDLISKCMTWHCAQMEQVIEEAVEEKADGSTLEGSAEAPAEEVTE